MITIGIGTLIGIIFGIIMSIAEDHDFGEWVASIFTGLFFGFVLGAIVAIMIPKDGVKITVRTANLENLKDNSGIQGNFFLGCGNVNGTMQYAFYENLGNNQYRLKTVNCNEVVIEYIDSLSHPRIEEYSMRRTDTKHNRFTILPPLLRGERVKIYVPKGSIKQNFVLDAQ